MAGRHDGRIRVRLAARPIAGAANEALVRFLAEACRVPRRAITLTAGTRGRRKTVLIAGAMVATVARGLGQDEPLSARGETH